MDDAVNGGRGRRDRGWVLLAMGRDDDDRDAAWTRSGRIRRIVRLRSAAPSGRRRGSRGLVTVGLFTFQAGARDRSEVPTSRQHGGRDLDVVRRTADTYAVGITSRRRADTPTGRTREMENGLIASSGPLTGR